MYCTFQESFGRMQYLLDIYLFDQSDIDLNSEVLMWPQSINPIYDQNDDVSRQICGIHNKHFITFTKLKCIDTIDVQG